MRVLLTGASGFIGRNILLQKPAHWQVVALYRQTGFLDFIAHHAIPQVTPVYCDLADAANVAQLKNIGPDYDLCLHLAARVDTRGSVLAPLSDLTPNLIGLINLLEIIRCQRFIFMSSGAVYDGLKGEVSPELSLTPRLPYAINKLAAEHYVRGYTHFKQHIASFVNLRFMGAYGPYEAPHKIYTKMLRSFVLGDQSSFTIYGNGANLIDAMYIDDCVQGLIMMAHSTAANLTVDFGCGAPLTIRQLVEKTAAIFGKQIQIYTEGASVEPIEFYINPASVASLFGFRPSTPYEAGIRRLAEHLAQDSRS